MYLLKKFINPQNVLIFFFSTKFLQNAKLHFVMQIYLILYLKLIYKEKENYKIVVYLYEIFYLKLLS